MKNTTGKTYSEPDIGMRFTARKFQRMGPDKGRYGMVRYDDVVYGTIRFGRVGYVTVR